MSKVSCVFTFIVAHYCKNLWFFFFDFVSLLVMTFYPFFFWFLMSNVFFQHLSIMIVESKSCDYSFFMCIFEYFQIATLCVMDFVLIDLTQAFGCWLYQVDLLTWFLSSDNVIRKILFFSSIKTMNFISWFTNLYGTTVEFRISV